MNFGVQLMKSRAELRQHHGAAGDGNAHREAAAGEILDVLQAAVAQLQRFGYLHRRLIQHPAGVRQSHGVAPVKQGNLIVFLQFGNVAAEGLLRNIKPPRGPGEIQLLGRCDKVGEVGQVHENSASREKIVAFK